MSIGGGPVPTEREVQYLSMTMSVEELYQYLIEELGKLSATRAVQYGISGPLKIEELEVRVRLLYRIVKPLSDESRGYFAERLLFAGVWPSLHPEKMIDVVFAPGDGPLRALAAVRERVWKGEAQVLLEPESESHPPYVSLSEEDIQEMKDRAKREGTTLTDALRREIDEGNKARRRRTNPEDQPS